MTTRVRAASRLHVTLLDLGNATPRRYGGVGVMIDRPGIAVTASHSHEWRFRSEAPLDRRAQKEIGALLTQMARIRPKVAADVLVTALGPQHVGLGTKTGLLLSVLAAVNRELELGLHRLDLQRLSGRGGTSGIGLHGFFIGGAIADAGHPNDPRRRFGPSSSRRPVTPPLFMQRLRIPPAWRFTLLLPRGSSHSGAAEARFFDRHTPLPHREVLAAIGWAYHGVMSAFAVGDLAALRTSLATLHTIGFKARELNAQSREVRVLYSRLLSIPGVAVGLSSMGPLIYVVRDKADLTSQAQVRRILETVPATHLGDARGSNSSYRVMS